MINIFYATCLSRHLFADTSTSSWQLRRSHQKEAQEMGFRAGREAARGAGRRDCFQAQEAGLQIKAGIAGAEWGCPGQTRETTHPPPLQPFSRMLSLPLRALVLPCSSDLWSLHGKQDDDRNFKGACLKAVVSLPSRPWLQAPRLSVPQEAPGTPAPESVSPRPTSHLL